MKKAILSLVLFISAALLLKAQPNFSEHIAPIIYNKCAECHHPGAIAPDPLLTYDDVSGQAVLVMDAVNARKMPPWPPDPSYSTFAHQRTLTAEEIQTINDWVMNGFPRGDSTLAPPIPVFNDGPKITAPDISKSIGDYVVQTAKDEYRCFAVPSGLEEAKYMSAIEIIPGNRRIVHHVLVYYDSTGQCLAKDNADPLPGYSCFGGTGCNSAQLVGLWAPGSEPQKYPAGMGVRLAANGYFILQVHYAPGSQAQGDSTRINVKLTPDNFVRPVYIAPPLNHFFLSNGPLIIQANTTKTFYAKYTVPSTTDISVFSIGPHMHLIGKSIKVYAFSSAASADTIPLINIPDWRFSWQGGYFFPKVLKVPKGTVLQSEALYDNTSANENNPNLPPKLVTLGEATTDEMMLVYFAYTAYFPGDENIVQDSALLTVSVKEATAQTIADLQVYPNPSSGEVSLYLKIKEPTVASLRIIDLSGRIVMEVWKNQDISQPVTVHPLKLDNLTGGIYLLDYESKGRHEYARLSIAK